MLGGQFLLMPFLLSPSNFLKMKNVNPEIFRLKSSSDTPRSSGDATFNNVNNGLSNSKQLL
jgi:hypothetical protein